ncbi:ABC transporter ATP-binding protein [Gracilibacillus salinarum]|uniref:ABC transporter ATP-binding protein/permease n=1 Tax=Gracilibacillus salinarum TaxID=2932255 RepID=A0ABY4GQ03_9BACI|nr:ABC transporter ATP-binding protein [Gracilibacillus salinarum]UOQ86223.1 ABC transporter ATP-binding protein/permease [Gracilibacillus salinarum]
MNPSTEKRLLRYAFTSKKFIIIGLVCLIIAVGLELSGPLIAKRVIDHHIVGVQANWKQVNAKDDPDTIAYQDMFLKRADRVIGEDDVINDFTLLQSERSYYLIEGNISATNTVESAENGLVTVRDGDSATEVEGQRISAAELVTFFQPEFHPIILLLALYIGLILIAAVFQYFKTYLLQVSANKIIQRMRNDVFTQIEKLPMKYFVDRPAGKIVARVTNDTEAIRELYVKVLETFVNGFVYMTGIFIALFLLNPPLASFCLILIPLLYLWMKFYKNFAGKYNRVIRSTNSEINASINESIQGMPVIQAFRRTKETQDEFEVLNNRHFAYQKKMIVLSALTSFNLVNAIRGIAFVGFIWFFGSASLTGESIVTAGVLYAFVDYLTRLFEPMTQIVNQLPQLEQARVAGGRVFELLDEETEVVGKVEEQNVQGDILFRDVSFAYEKDEYVLNNLSFHIKPGQMAAFVGHTGSGKSSIMNVLFRFYDPQHGKIEIDGVNTMTRTRQQIRQSIGIVLQDPFIFTGTVLSNITLEDPTVSRDKAIAALKAVGADQFIEKLPQQYDEPVGENGSQFSTGQRQLLSFARALAFDPAILILDEATANIDTETEGMIQEAMQVLAKDRTMLVIAHRLSTIQHADQIIVLERGKIIETGSHHELLKQKGNYYQMYQMQLGTDREVTAV